MTHGEASAERSFRTAETVAVLGAGATMGFAMARNIARAGIAVRAWNRTKAKAEPLADDGAYIADTPAESAEGAGIVLTMLADAETVTTAMESDHGALPELIAHQLGQAGGEHGDKDYFSATYLTSAPDRVA